MRISLRTGDDGGSHAAPFCFDSVQAALFGCTAWYCIWCSFVAGRGTSFFRHEAVTRDIGEGTEVDQAP